MLFDDVFIEHHAQKEGVSSKQFACIAFHSREIVLCSFNVCFAQLVTSHCTKNFETVDVFVDMLATEQNSLLIV